MNRVTEDYQLKQFTAHPINKMRRNVSEKATHEEEVNRFSHSVSLDTSAAGVSRVFGGDGSVCLERLNGCEARRFRNPSNFA